MVTWVGRVPARCQLCSADVVDGFADARLPSGGAWAFMCPDCHTKTGRSVGQGRGQVYRRVEGRFVCVEGGRSAIDEYSV
jgi:cytochrome c553